jgi:small-conductance mechanosensitive channel
MTMDIQTLESVLRPWLATGISLTVALAAGVIGWRIALAVLRRVTRHRVIPGLFITASESAGLAVLVMVLAQPIVHAAPDSLYGIDTVRHAVAILLIVAGTWLAVRLSNTIADAVAVLHPSNVEDNLQARRIITQTRVLTRTLSSLIVLLGFAFALLTFPGVRNLGASLLASAGIAGLVVGIAARPVLANLLAGLQIALTQPIRIDDVVIVEGEWGRIEDIGRAFVTVAIWDQRRLVVPLQYFIEKPFQNWTRASSEILGTVFLWVDYGMPLDALRAELKRICEGTPLWDKRVCLIQVVEVSERAMQLRALVSAADASRAWDLRCLVREGLLDYIRREHPQFFPRVRAAGDAGGKPAGGPDAASA